LKLEIDDKIVTIPESDWKDTRRFNLNEVHYHLTLAQRWLEHMEETEDESVKE
jgi:hypothetical protein